MDDSKGTASFRHNRTETHMDTQRLWAHTARPAWIQTTQNPSIKRGSGQKVPSLTKKLFAIYLSFKDAKVYTSFLGFPRPWPSIPSIFSITCTICHPVLYMAGREGSGEGPSSWEGKGKLSPGIATLTLFLSNLYPAFPPPLPPLCVHGDLKRALEALELVTRLWTAQCGC